MDGDPPVVNLGRIRPEGAKQRVAVRARDAKAAPLKLVVKATEGSGVRAWAEPNPGDPAEWLVWVEAKPGGPAFLEGEVQVQTDDPKTPVYYLRYLGYATPKAGGLPAPG